MSLSMELPTSSEWYVLKGDEKYGPYSYEQMIVLMQSKFIYNFDFAWAPELETWTSLSEIPEFSPERLRLIVEKVPDDEKDKAFNRRVHKRVNVNIPVLCHNDERMWQGKCESISFGGALIAMDNPLLLPDSKVIVSFRSHTDGDVTFNSETVVVAKRFTKKRIQHNTSIYYALSFIDLNEAAKFQIAKWIK